MDNSRMIPAIILIVFGIALLFNLNILRLFWPLVLIFVGVVILTNKGRSAPQTKSETSNENKINEEVIFSGLNKKINSDNFQGGKITTIFGGGEIDLTESKIPADTTADLEINAIFGGVKVIVPKEWNVSSSVTGIFGGFNNSTQFPTTPSGRLLIKGSAVFGGGEVTNK